MRYSGIGGQAVMEGVMMRNGLDYAIAVRTPEKEIEIKKEKIKEKSGKIRKIPFVRGVFSFVDSLVLGLQSLTYSASFYEEEDTKEKVKKEQTKEEKERKEKIEMGFTIALSFVLALGLFMVLPYGVSRLIGTWVTQLWAQNLLEGILRVIIFVGYISLISKMEDIKRVFMYHGAEHKCINCIEHGLPLTVENVKKSSRLHKRCGTSFLLIVCLISIFVFMFIHAPHPLLQLGLRLLLVPVIAGISYEFLRLAGRSDNILIHWLSKPGMCLQKMTTAEPTEDMIEVGIAAVEAVFDWEAFLSTEETVASKSQG